MIVRLLTFLTCVIAVMSAWAPEAQALGESSKAFASAEFHSHSSAPQFVAGIGLPSDELFETPFTPFEGEETVHVLFESPLRLKHSAPRLAHASFFDSVFKSQVDHLFRFYRPPPFAA